MQNVYIAFTPITGIFIFYEKKAKLGTNGCSDPNNQKPEQHSPSPLID